MKSILYIGNKLSMHAFTPGVIETLGPLLKKEGYIVSYAGTHKCQFMRLAEMTWKAVTIGRKADYILIDTYSTAAFWYAYLTGRFARLLNKKYIPILHGGELPARLEKSKMACNGLFLNSYANVAVSGYLKDEFKKSGYHTVVIPNSIEIAKYPFKLRDQPAARLLWVRSFHKQYNPQMAADVLAKLLKNDPAATLCMVGPDKDGSMEEFRQYIRQQGIENNVKVTGRITKDEWIKLSEDYDFFINTTNVDNTPVSVIEAMALGMCVISTNPGGIPYLLTEGTDALLVKPGDYRAMANKITHIINDPVLAASLSKSGRHKAESFDWEQVKGKWINLLKRKMV